MDYHISQLDGFDKPLFFWTKEDFMTYVQYLDSLSEAIKNDYQKIADHLKTTKQDLLTADQRQTVQHSIVDWASQQQIFIDDSENTAFPFASDINKADFQFSQLKTASDIVTTALAQIGVESESQHKKEEIESPNPPGQGMLTDVVDIVRWGVIGLGIYVAYKVFQDFRR